MYFLFFARRYWFFCRVDVLEKEETGGRAGSLPCAVSCVSLHVATFSLKLTSPLISSAPDLLLLCHADMFNKYCPAEAALCLI